MPQTQFLDLPDGKIAYDMEGEGSLIVLVPGMADTRAAYRFLAPKLVAAGYRVVRMDLRGHGESSTTWPSFTRTDVAQDVLALIDHLNVGPATLVGQSFSGGSATIAAALRPDLVARIVEIAPFTRAPKFGLSAFARNDHNYRNGALALGRFLLTGKVAAWRAYLELAYPGKPADWNGWLGDLEANLSEPGRVKAAQAMMKASPKDAGDALRNVNVPALIIMGEQDSDFADPVAEASGICTAMTATQADSAILPGVGHYPHAQAPDEVATLIRNFAG